MKTIVFIDGEKHSAWYSAAEAKHQCKVLENYGYKGVYWEYLDDILS